MSQKYASQFDKMTREPVESLILKLALPTTLSMMVTNIYNMADTYFVGRLGTSASGATGVVFGLMAILQAVGFMLGHGSGSIIGRALGAKDSKRANTFGSTSFFISLSVGLLFSLFGILFVNPLVKLLGSTETILPYARTYAICILAAAPAMVSSCVMNNILRYEGRAVFAMVGLVSGGLLNIGLDALFIIKFGMGIEGAGIATTISQYVSAFILLYMYISKKTITQFRIKYITRNFSDVLLILKTGLPSLIRQGLGSVSVMVLNHMAGPFGDAAIAAMSIVARVANFVFSAGLGIGQGYQPVAGFNYGAKKYSRVKRGFFFTWYFGTILLSIVAVVAFIFASPIIAFFRDDMEVIRIGIPAMRYQCASLLFMPFTLTNNMMFQSTGQNKEASLLSSLRSGLCFIPVILILTPFFGLWGIQVSQAVADVIGSVLCIPFTVRFFRNLPPDAVD